MRASLFLGLLALLFALLALAWGIRSLHRLHDGLRVSTDSLWLLASSLGGAVWFGGPARALRRPSPLAFGWSAVALALPLVYAVVALVLTPPASRAWPALAVLALGAPLVILLGARRACFGPPDNGRH